jgi:hypothetical protein
MFGSKKRVRIEFIDIDTGQMLGFDEKRPNKIPPTFRYETLIKFGGKTWKLVEAEPFERKDFLKSGLLTIKVRLQEDAENPFIPPIPAEEKLYRSVSRSAQMPESAGKRKGKLLEMGAWEWRNIELISQDFRSDISREMGAIESIRQTASTEQNGQVMYREQHIRDLPEDVLQLKNITVGILGKSWFPFSNAFDGINFMGVEGSTYHTFAFRLPAGLTIYGHTSRQQIQAIGLLHPDTKHKLIAMQDIQRLVDFMDAHTLVLVDWERNKFVEPILPALAHFFGVSEDDSSSDLDESADKSDSYGIEQDSQEDLMVSPALSVEIPVNDIIESESKSESESSSAEEMLFTAHTTSSIPLPPPPVAPDEDSLDFKIDHSVDSDVETPVSDEEE